jgi:Domain of unknown function (DUF4360)
MRIFAASFGLLVVALLVTASLTRDSLAESCPDTPAPPVPAAHVVSVMAGGTGCPDAAAEATVAGDILKVQLNRSFSAEAGPGRLLSASRKNCQVNIQLDVPDGFTYAIKSVETSGYSSLPAGAKGYVQTTTYFTGEQPQATARREFVGPLAEDFSITETIDDAALVFAPCDVQRALNINSQVKVDKGTSASHEVSSITVDGATFGQSYQLVFARCPQ